MNERIVFFYDRDRRSGCVYRRGAVKAGSRYLYQVYSRLPLDEAQLEPSDEGIDAAHLAALVAAAGGGLIAETRQTGDLVALHVQSIPAEGYERPNGMLMLAPGQEPKPIQIGDRGVTLIAGELAVVPATADDEANLAALIKHLEQLPGDYRGLVFDVLRQPGIDGAMRRLTLRIDELLERLGKAPAHGVDVPGPVQQHEQTAVSGVGAIDRAAARENRLGATIGGFWPWLLAVLLLINLAGLAAGTWLLPAATAQRIERGASNPESSRPPQPPAAEPATEADCVAQAGLSPWLSLYTSLLDAQDERIQTLEEGLNACTIEAAQAAAAGISAMGQADDPKQAINDLIETWMIQAYAWPANDPRRLVAEAHFSNDQGGRVYVEDWLEDRAGGADEPYFRRQERIAYALAKLVLLTDGVQINGNAPETLKRFDFRTNVKDAIKTLVEKLRGSAEDDNAEQIDNDRHLLAWLACDVFPKGLLNGQARFVRVDKNADPDATEEGDDDMEDRDVDLGLACDDLDESKVVQAIGRHREALFEPAQ
jgi:hypothetical protein